MTLDGLYDRLVSDGYGHLIFVRGPWGLAVGDLRIERKGGTFTICWSERGEVLETVLVTADEQEACNAFRAKVASISWHLATSTDRATIERLGEELGAAGIETRRNDIPDFNGPGDARYRIFVQGSDLARGGEIASSLDPALSASLQPASDRCYPESVATEGRSRMAWVKFLVIAAILMALCLGGLGAWLLPMMGVDPFTARIVAGAVGGVLVVLLLQRMKPGAPA